MSLQSLTQTIQGQTLVFTNQRALYWQEQSSLIISDLHIGKTAYFRKHGIPVPSDLLHHDLERLGELVLHFKAQELLIVGDFLHAGKNTDFEIFEAWRRLHPHLRITLIKGNHDLKNADFLRDLDITILEDSLLRPPFTFIHIPQSIPHQFSISGHLHPGVVIQLEKRKYIRLPCFRVSNKQLILPAFSAFTGLDTTGCEGFDCIGFTDEVIFVQ